MVNILVVEDEPGIYNFLRQGLEEESFVVDIADKGSVGLDLALSVAYDIILLDWMLPEVSGIEICRRVRERDPLTPIIFLTAKDTLQETILGLEAGANDYIKKPFSFEELLARIKVQLRPRSDENRGLALGPITMDLDAHQVFKNEVEIALTQREFALLEYLIRHKGRVCSRTRIIESVWDIHFEYDSSVIDVYINALRRKLDLSKDDHYIQTVRGIGYLAREL